MKKDFEYIRVAACVPEVKIANPMYNVNEIISLSKKAA